jgi:LysM repeat protein
MATNSIMLCPYLGMADDRQTKCIFSFDGHRCYRDGDKRTAYRIPRDHQDRYCLKRLHTTCPNNPQAIAPAGPEATVLTQPGPETVVGEAPVSPSAGTQVGALTSRQAVGMIPVEMIPPITSTEPPVAEAVVPFSAAIPVVESVPELPAPAEAEVFPTLETPVEEAGELPRFIRARYDRDAGASLPPPPLEQEPPADIVPPPAFLRRIMRNAGGETQLETADDSAELADAVSPEEMAPLATTYGAVTTAAGQPANQAPDSDETGSLMDDAFDSIGRESDAADFDDNGATADDEPPVEDRPEPAAVAPRAGAVRQSTVDNQGIQAGEAVISHVPPVETYAATGMMSGDTADEESGTSAGAGQHTDEQEGNNQLPHRPPAARPAPPPPVFSNQGRGVLILVGMVAAAVLLAVVAIFALAQVGTDQFTEPVTPIPAVANKAGTAPAGSTPRVVVSGTPAATGAITTKPAGAAITTTAGVTVTGAVPLATAASKPVTATGTITGTGAVTGTQPATTTAPAGASSPAAADAVASAWDLRLSGATLGAIIVPPTATPAVPATGPSGPTGAATPVPGARAAVAPAGTTTHKVQRGETVYGIALQYKTTTEAILKANPTLTDENKIQVDMVLIIPIQR